MRGLDAATGQSLTDYASTSLSPNAMAVVAQLTGRTCRKLDTADMEALQRRYGLFTRGLPALTPDATAFAPAANALA